VIIKGPIVKPKPLNWSDWRKIGIQARDYRHGYPRNRRSGDYHRQS